MLQSGLQWSPLLERPGRSKRRAASRPSSLMRWWTGIAFYALSAPTTKPLRRRFSFLLQSKLPNGLFYTFIAALPHSAYHALPAKALKRDGCSSPRIASRFCVSSPTMTFFISTFDDIDGRYICFYRKMLSQRSELLAGCQQCEVEHSQEGSTWEQLGRLLNDVRACAR